MSDFPAEESVPLDDSEVVPSDELEPITEEETAALGVAPSTEESQEAEEPHIAYLVCDVCLELNLTTKSVIKCARCDNAFCYHFQSAIDSQYCVNCMSDISLTKQVITKTYESTNPETGEKSFYRRRARDIKIDGLSWLFAQRRITELADVELDLAIEYHRNICSLMIAESERRRNEKMHRYANVKLIPIPSTTTVSTGTTTTVKKTRTVSKNKAAEGAAAILSSMLGKGMSIQDILKAVAKK